jgi:hypothetical protein
MNAEEQRSRNLRSSGWVRGSGSGLWRHAVGSLAWRLRSVHGFWRRGRGSCARMAARPGPGALRGEGVEFSWREVAGWLGVCGAGRAGCCACAGLGRECHFVFVFLFSNTFVHI